tara:strand:- start:2380 stop:3315 length:936 start_codon:yes stop_codon:yes gene_type:complete
MKSYSNFVDVNDDNWLSIAKENLNKDGLVVLRNIVEFNSLERIVKSSANMLKNPSMLGSVGYYQKEFTKKTYDGLLLGKDAVNIVGNEKLLDLTESYLQDEVRLTEVFLKHDTGVNQIYFPYHRHPGKEFNLSKEVAFGCGVLLYLHDTNSGAFCYSLGSHNSEWDYKNYPSLIDKKDEDDINKNFFRIIGKSGDLVIFDERGFHGPEQPTTASRTILLFGYQSSKATNNTTKTENPVIINNLIDLNNRQLTAMGIQSNSRTFYKDYHLRTSVSMQKKTKVISIFVKFCSILENKISVLKNILKFIIRKKK